MQDEPREKFTQKDFEDYLKQVQSGKIPGGGAVPASAPGADVPVNNNNGGTASAGFTQSETDIVAFGNTVVIAFNDAGSYGGTAPHFTGWSYSTNRGTSFVDGGVLPTSTLGDGGDPVLARDEVTGRIYLSTLGFSISSTIQMFRSDDGGITWLPPTVATPGGSSEDKQWHVVDNFPGTGQGYVYMISRRFGTGPGIYVFRSTDQGATFTPNLGVNITTAPASQGAYIEVGPDHSVYAFWYAGTTIQVRKSTDFGVTFGPQTTVVSGLVGGTNGDLGLTGIRQGTTTASGFRSSEFPHVAVHRPTGHLYVTFANLGVFPDKADVLYVRSTDGGATWSAAIKVNDDTGTTDQWQPTITITPNGNNIGIFYYSRQEDATGNNLFKYYGRLGWISGGVVTWDPSFAVSDVASLPEFGRDAFVNSLYMGDYNHAVSTNSAMHVVWSDNRDKYVPGPPRKDPNVYYDKIVLATVANVTVHQSMSDSVTEVGTLGRWNGSSFGPRLPAPQLYEFQMLSRQVLHGDTLIHQNEKYLSWIRGSVQEPSVLNHHEFFVDGWFPSFLRSQFGPTAPAIVIKTGLLDLPGISAGTIKFRDPWYIDSADQDYANSPRNRGQADAVFHVREVGTTGFLPDYETQYDGGRKYRGVFLNQNPQWDVTKPNYSVGAPETQSIGGWESHFVSWYAHPGSAAFQYPGSTTTGVVFNQPNATVTAQYKAPLASSTPAATSANSQRKIATASNGVSHAVYESGGSIWYTRSNGSGWTQEKPLRLFTNAKYPAIAWGVDPSIQLHVVWQESVSVPYVGWRKRVCYVRSTDAGSTWENPIPVCGGQFGDMFTSTDVDPLPALATGTATAVVIWRKHDNYGSGFACRADPWNSGWSIQNVPATDGTTETPALVGADGWKLAYGKDAGKILYREFTVNSNGAFSFTPPEDLTAGYPWMVESNRPSIASSAGRTFVVWEGARDQVIEDESPLSGAVGRRQVFLREKTSVWQPVTELSYYWGTDEITPVVGLDNSKVTVLWNWGVTGLARASRDLTGSGWSVAHVGYGYWPALAVFTQSGTPLRMSTGVPGPPHAVQFEQDPPSSPLADAKAGDEPGVSGAGRGALVSRTATLVLDSLTIPTIGRGAVSGRVIVAASLPEVRTESGRLPVSFRRDTLKFERWLETEGTAIPPNATEARLPVALSLRGVRINNPGVPTSFPVLQAGMRAGSKSTLLGRVTIGDLLASAGRDTTIRLAPTVALDRHRNATLEFTQRLSGVEEGLVAWTEMVSADTSLDAGPTATASAAKQPAAAASLPETFLIRDAFPNPFNPSTEIRYELPEPARVSLTVYDVLGRVVEALLDETKEAGYHAVKWDAAGRSSGVYLARFTATAATGTVALQRTMKLVLAK